MGWNKSRLYKKKKCNACGDIKTIAAFYNNPQTYCKQCVKKKAIDSYSVVGSRAWHTRQYYRFKSRVKSRGVECSLSPEDYTLIKSEPCYYCGVLYEYKMSIDRVDNSVGYLMGNCVAACYRCNRLKAAVSVEICRKVIDFIDRAD